MFSFFKRKKNNEALQNDTEQPVAEPDLQAEDTTLSTAEPESILAETQNTDSNTTDEKTQASVSEEHSDTLIAEQVNKETKKDKNSP